MSPKKTDAPSLEKAWRHALLDVFARVGTGLADPSPTDEAVHAARRELKRLAALTRLAPASLRPLARDTRAAADLARKALGGRRDAAVLARLIETSALKLGSSEPAVRAAVENIAKPLAADALAEARGLLEGLRAQWGAAAVADAELVERAVKTYRRARRLMRKAQDGSAKALHSWRGAVVAHHYQMAFMARLAPSLKSRAKAVDALRDRLGDWNDIDMLQVHTRRALDRADRRALGEAVADDKEKLVKAAGKAGLDLFERRARDFAGTLREALATATVA